MPLRSKKKKQELVLMLSPAEICIARIILSWENLERIHRSQKKKLRDLILLAVLRTEVVTVSRCLSWLRRDLNFQRKLLW